MRYSVIFATGDGPDDLEIGNAIGLSASTLFAAEAEARVLLAPEGAKVLKMRDEGFVVNRLWISPRA